MNRTFIIILAVIVAALLYFLAPILTPFLVGALLAYLVNPIVIQLMRLHIPRLAAVVIVFFILCAIITLLVFLLIPVSQTQLQRLTEVVPDIIVWVQNTALPSLKEYVGTQQLFDVNAIKTHLNDSLPKAGGFAGWLLATIFHSGVAILHVLFNLILIFVVTFYLLYDWKKFINGLHGLVPRKYEPTVVKLTNDCNTVLGAFFRGQLLVMTTLGIYYAIGLSLIGLKIGIMIGVIIGLLTIVPYLGIIVGIIMASVAAIVQFGTFMSVIPVLILFAIGQTLDGMFITPKLVGDRIGLHPVAVIFAVLAGATLFGFFGVLLALPVAAISMVLLRFVNHHYVNSKLYR